MDFRQWHSASAFPGYLRRILPIVALAAFTSARGEAASDDPSPVSASATSVQGASNPRSPEFEMAANGSVTFADAAVKAGISAAREEVANRLETYKRLCPGKEFNPREVEKIVLAEKYLAARGIGAGDEELDRAVAGVWNPSGYTTPEAAEQAKQALRTQLLLEKKEVKGEAAKMEDLAQLERESRVQHTPQWETADLQIEGDPEACMAWSGSGCFVTLREYNAACTQFRITTLAGRDSAKSAVLRDYLLDKRRAELARESGLGQRPDSLVERANSIWESRLWDLAAPHYGIPVYDETRLQATYAKYYGRYFAAREKITFALAGSTDSVYLDSLHKVLAAWEKAASAGHGPAKSKVREPRLPWAYFELEELPRELAAPADSLRIGQTSKSFATPYGHFLVRLAKVAHIKEVTPGQAHSRLVFLATRDKFLDMDSVIEAKARRYYAENRIRYSLPDTLRLRAWLVPGLAKPRTAKAEGKAKPQILSDTVLFRAKAVSSLALPKEMRILLQQTMRKDSLASFFGPLPDRYGRWYFQILSRKLAHQVLPYRLVRKDIVERISALPKEAETGLATEESINEVLLNIGLSEAYELQEQRASMEAKGEGQGIPDVAQSPPSSPLSEADMDKRIAAEMAHMREEQARYRRGEDKLLAGTRVNLSLLIQ